MYISLNSCNQEVNLVAIVGDRNSTGQFVIQNKLQWFGILMTRGMGLGQVPDFWQMPDMIRYLPAWARDIFDQSGNPVVIRGWRELF